MKKKQRVERRWDKVLAKWYGIPKMARQHAKRQGSSVEMMLSTWLQNGTIKHRELPTDKDHPIYWRYV
jgi:hypothetical protein